MTYMIVHNLFIKGQNTMNKNMQYITDYKTSPLFSNIPECIHSNKWYLPQVTFQKNELPLDFLKYSYK